MFFTEEKLKQDKEDAIVVAIDFGYYRKFPGIITEINKAQNPIQVDRILGDCRRKYI